MIENPNQKVWVMASPEILEEMRTGWSRPVEVRAFVNLDGSWEMTFRACYDEKGEQVARG